MLLGSLRAKAMSLALLGSGLILSACGTSTDANTPAAAPAEPSMVEFHIPAGTGNGSWNTQAMPVEVTIGQTLRIYNDDTVTHRVHTNGVPFAHGADIAPGAFGDHLVTGSFEVSPTNFLYDHGYGVNARFWVNSTRQ